MKRILTLLLLAATIGLASAQSTPRYMPRAGEGLSDSETAAFRASLDILSFPDPEAIPVDVFFLLGQSNASGRADSGFVARPSDSEILYFYDTDGPSGTLRDSGGEFVTLGPLDTGYYGSEISAARALRTAGYAVAVIKISRGGTSLAVDWDAPSGDAWELFVAESAVALAALVADGYVPRIRAVFWSQGEGDANATDAPNYEANFTTFVAGVESHLDGLGYDVSALEWVVAQTQSSNPDPYWADVADAQGTVMAGLSGGRGHSFSTATYATIDGVHYDAAALGAMGQSFADALAGASTLQVLVQDTESGLTARFPLAGFRGADADEDAGTFATIEPSSPHYIFGNGTTNNRNPYWPLGTAGTLLRSTNWTSLSECLLEGPNFYLDVLNPSVTGIPTATGNAWMAIVDADYHVYVQQNGSSSSDFRKVTTIGTVEDLLDKSMRVAVIVTGASTTAPVIVVNDVVMPTTETTGGTPPQWAHSSLAVDYRLIRNVTQPTIPQPILLRPLSTAEAQRWTTTGLIPSAYYDVESLTYPTSGRSYTVSDANNTTGLQTSTYANYTAESGARSGGSGSYFSRGTATGTSSASVLRAQLGTSSWAGAIVSVSAWVRSSNAGNHLIALASSSGDAGTSIAAQTTVSLSANTWTQISYSALVTGSSSPFLRIYDDTGAVGAGDTLDLDDVEVTVMPSVLMRPYLQYGQIIGDAGDFRLCGVLRDGSFHNSPATTGECRARLTWAGTHESKAAFPTGGAIPGTSRSWVAITPTFSTTGSGATIGNSNSATLYQSATALTAGVTTVTPPQITTGGTATGVLIAPDDLDVNGSTDVVTRWEAVK